MTHETIDIETEDGVEAVVEAEPNALARSQDDAQDDMVNDKTEIEEDDDDA